MKTMTRTLLMLAALMLCGCSGDNNEVMAQTRQEKLQITIGGDTRQATLVDNAATQELVARLQQSPVTLSLDTNGSFEIWGPLGFSLPTSNQQITAQPGDIILYSGSNICLFCGSNSWSYTRLGHIDGMTETELRTFLHIGESGISVTLSLAGTTGIHQVRTNDYESKAYTLQGTLAQAGTKGIVIQNGKKVIR
ncbi:MAG: hypothetical protein ILA25_03930 [Prevotella sp.]|nr:hypothetical protein [Prevotella sp.]